MPEGKVKKPVYRKWWFWTIIGVLSIWFAVSNGNNNDNSSVSNSAEASTKVSKKTSEVVPKPAFDLASYKTSCSDITYDVLARETERHIGDKVILSGQIIQIIESGKKIAIRVNVTKGEYDIYQDTVFVNYVYKSGEKRFLDSDIIKLWGEVKGRRSYKSVLNAKITIPEIDAVAIEIVE